MIANTIFNINPDQKKKDDFGQWLSGFIDGEGCFQILVSKSNRIGLRFQIALHIDDIQVLYKIQNFLKTGNIYISVKEVGTYCIYNISNVESIITKLVPVLDTNKLRTTKYLDYIDFRTVCFILHEKLSNIDVELVRKIKSGINTGRVNPDISNIPKTIININWLIGFIEGEGTFGFKHLRPYFQLGQHKRNKHVLDNIVEYLESLPSLYNYSTNYVPLKMSISLNKRTNVYIISNVNCDSLYDIIAHHFLQCTFHSRKNIDFFFWCIALYIKKHGYFYIKQGRIIAITIAKYVNISRYTTSGINPIFPIIDIKFLTSTLPVKLTPTISHLELSHAFAKLNNKDRAIWVYDNNVLVNGSPFNKIADASVSIGIDRKSLTISRYIDTGKLYKNRYSFYSKPILNYYTLLEDYARR